MSEEARVTKPKVLKGERFYKDDGTLYCTAKRDLFPHERVQTSQFEWPGKPPEAGSDIESVEMRLRIWGWP